MMNRSCSVLLGLVLALFASVLAACDGERGYLENDLHGGPSAQESAATTGGDSHTTTTTSTADGKDPNAVGPLPTNVSAKQFFTQTVHPAISSCGGCHSAGPGPAWIAPTDAEKTYTLVFGRGYVTRDSALLKKGVHSSGSAPALSADQRQKLATWIELELKDRGDKAPPSVLDKLGGCLDKQKFDAIGFEDLMTTTRTKNNNPKGETEDANTCTGCKPRECAVCHSSDPATGFIMAVNNNLFDEDYTFKETKKAAPAPYLQKYFGLDTDGDPVASHAIRAKSDNTVNVAKAYQHPMFTLDAKTELALNNFVEDAITKYKAGKCGK